MNAKDLSKASRREKQSASEKERRDSSLTRRDLDKTVDMTSSSEEEDDQPSAKVSKPSVGLRETLTKAYAKKVDETKRARGHTTSNVDFNVTEINETVEAPTVPLLAPVKLADAPILSLKSLMPEGFQGEVKDDETIKTSRLDFLILYRKPDKGEVAMELDDPKIDRQIPNQATFEKVMDTAICDFTEDDPDRLEVIEFSKVGWNTGVGLVGFRTDNMDLVGEFAEIVKTMILPELNLRFCIAPRKLLMDKYALTCYFNLSLIHI